MRTFDEHITRYFEGRTSPEEEQELAAFLASPVGQGAEYDEVRAVMAYFSVGKALRTAAPGVKKQMPARSRFARIAAAAAVVALLAGTGISLHRNKEITEMKNTLAELLTDDSRPDVSEGLGEIFK